MKKSIRILAVVLVAVMLCMTLASCGKKLSGTYELDLSVAGTGVVNIYEFSGKKVNITIEVKFAGAVTETVSFEGTYSIEDDKITIDIEDDGEYDLSGTFDFAETEDGIKIALVEYKKAE